MQLKKSFVKCYATMSNVEFYLEMPLNIFQNLGVSYDLHKKNDITKESRINLAVISLRIISQRYDENKTFFQLKLCQV